MRNIDGRPRVVLITPPVYDFAFFDLFAKPYGLLRIGRWLRDSGYEVVHINALAWDDPISIGLHGSPNRNPNGTGKVFRVPALWPLGDTPLPRTFARYGIDEETLRDRIHLELKRAADLVLVGTGMTYWYPGVREVVQAVREIRRDIPVIAGGVYATLLPEHCRTACGVDDVIVGQAWPALAERLEKLGLPAPDAPPADRVLPDDPVWRDAGVIRLNSGCPFHCDYCASETLNEGFRVGSGAETYRALCEIAEAQGTRIFAFYDDALLCSASDAFDVFAEEIIKSGNAFRFYLPNAVHFQFIDRRRAVLMRQAGFQEIRFGFESSDTTFHEVHGVKYRTGQVETAIAALRSAGYPGDSITLYVLAGLPNQDSEEVRQSILYAAGLGVRVELSEFSPVPGTNLWDECISTSPFPLETEPLYQNNTAFPMRSARFTLDNLAELKELIRASRNRK